MSSMTLINVTMSSDLFRLELPNAIERAKMCLEIDIKRAHDRNEGEAYPPLISSRLKLRDLSDLAFHAKQPNMNRVDVSMPFNTYNFLFNT